MPKTSAKKKLQKVVFVCHSSVDHEVIQKFKDGFFGKNQSNMAKGWRVRFTSDRADYDARLRTGSAHWQELTNDLSATEIFIACISNKFFKSAYCQCELGYYSGRKRQSGKPPQVFPIIVGRWEEKVSSHPIINNSIIRKDITKANDLKEFATEIKKSLKDVSVACKAVSDIAETASSVKSRSDNEASMDCVELALEHFRCKPPLDGPLTFFIPRRVYQNVAVLVSQEAQSKLLWTLFKSPLLVGDAYDNDFLMPYDNSFSEFKARKKIRLVIFEDTKMAQAYASCNVKYHNDRFKELVKGTNQSAIAVTKLKLISRRKAFQKSARKNKGLLLFTTVDRLNNELRRDQMQTLDKNSCLEFGWTQFEDGHRQNLLFASGHNSEFASTYNLEHRKHATETVRHLTFFKPPLSENYSEITHTVPYGGILKWVKWHEAIAEAVFNRTEKDCSTFVNATQINKL